MREKVVRIIKPFNRRRLCCGKFAVGVPLQPTARTMIKKDKQKIFDILSVQLSSSVAVHILYAII